MRYSIALVSFYAALAAARPHKRQQQYGTSINVVVSAGTDPNRVEEPLPMEFNTLSQLGALSLSSAILDAEATYGVNANQVECQFYKDSQGVEPAGIALNITSSPVEFTTDLVEVASVICIVKLAN